MGWSSTTVMTAGKVIAGVSVKSLVPELAMYVSPAALRKCTHSCTLIGLLNSTRIFPAIQASVATYLLVIKIFNDTVTINIASYDCS